MKTYYNETNPFAAQWIRNLIKAGHLPEGLVDTRSIEDVLPSDLKEFNQCHFFAGIGGWAHALQLARWPNDLPVWTGSCPCQPFSSASKGKGTSDERHLWPSFNHLIEQCKPIIVFGEQVASKAGLAWFDLVQADLDNKSYTSRAVDLCAAGVGSPHIRQRLYWVAYSDLYYDLRQRNAGQREKKITEASDRENLALARESSGANPNVLWLECEWIRGSDGKLRPIESKMDDGVSKGMGRVRAGKLKGYGNAIVPQLAAEFIKSTMEVLL